MYIKKMKLNILVFCSFIFIQITNINCAPDDELIKHLPGLNNVINFKQYSGYLNGSFGDHLHYWFVESSSNPTKDPVILWMNGGPGCSSLDGLFNELGPFHIKEDGDELYLNGFSWNKIANILFLEAPVCVGFSYKDSKGCQTSDDKTSLSNYLGLQSFFIKFPEFRKNPFFITGESYAGFYVPTLTVRVVDGNKQFPINLQGFAVGNGLSSTELNDNSIIFFAYYHGLIGNDLWTELIKHCCKNGIEGEEECNFSTSVWPKCHLYTAEAMEIIYKGGLNMYNLYAKCVHPKVLNGTSRSYHDRSNLFMNLRFNMMGSNNSRKAFKNLKLDPPCTDSSAMRAYLNQKSVQEAIHVQKSVWDICSDEVNMEYIRQYKSMRKQYEYLTQYVPALVYNGDVDMACNFLGDEWFADSLGLEVVQRRRMWYFDDQVAGFVKRFHNLDLVTIRGAGHMVPQDKPGPALKMISTFVTGKDY